MTPHDGQSLQFTRSPILLSLTQRHTHRCRLTRHKVSEKAPPLLRKVRSALVLDAEQELRLARAP